MLLPFRLGLALLSGLAMWAAFPTVSLPWLAPVGVGLLVIALRGLRPAAGFGVGVLAGLAWFLPYVSWTGVFVGPLPWLALAVLEALFVGFFGLLATLVRPGRARPVVLAAVWSAAEWARSSFPFGGFPWGRVAYSQADTPVLHLASMGGPALMGFVVALAGALLAEVLVVRPRSAGAAQLGRRVGLLAAAAVLLLAPAAIPTPTDGADGADGADGSMVTVMAVQGDAPRTGIDFNAVRRQILDNHVRETVAAAGRIRSGDLPQPDLVVWPENASDIDPFVNADAGRAIDAAVDAVDAPTLVGAVLGGGRSNLTNTTILWSPREGATDRRYDKRELVPFGEYMPYRAVFRAITNKVDLLERDFVPGRVPGVIEVPTGGGGTIHAGLAICFEVAIDHVVRDTVAQGADLIVVQTNNAMFGLSDESAQQLAISRVRAVEFGRSVVHASNVGVTALVTPDGVAHGATEEFTNTVVTGRLPLRTATTTAARLGVGVDVALALLALVGLVAPRVRRSRR